MPTYEYACSSCGQHIEVVHGFKDKPPKMCAACGGNLNKVFHPVGIVLKGSGFYKTDSRASSVKSSVKKKKDDTPKSDTSTSSSTSSSSESSSSTTEKSA